MDSGNQGPAEAGPGAATDQLAAWCAAVHYDQLPSQVVDAARLLILDALGCGLFGSTTPWGRIVADFAVDSATGDEASVWAMAPLVPAIQAPLANGTFVHCFEFDDLHSQAVLHGTAQVVPAALAVAELRARDSVGGAGREYRPTGAPRATELLAAIVAGLEAGARVGLATGSGQLRRGFHPSPNTGTFAAAATAGRLLHLDESAMAHAFGIAGSFGGALMAAQYGAMVKRVHPGRAAQAGVTAALLAARGLTGTGQVLEASYGGFAHAYVGAEAAAALESTVEGLGETWETPNFRVKVYPCCGSSHTAIDAYLSILDEVPDLTAEAVAQIEVSCSTLTLDHVGWPWRPDGVTAAQMNLPYTLAVLATDRAMSVDQFGPSRTHDPTLAELAARVRVQAAADIDALGSDGRHTVRLTVSTTDGRRYTREVRHSRSHAAQPVSNREVISKFRDLAGRVLEPSAVAAVESYVMGLGPQSPAAVAADLTDALRAVPRYTQPDAGGLKAAPLPDARDLEEGGTIR